MKGKNGAKLFDTTKRQREPDTSNNEQNNPESSRHDVFIEVEGYTKIDGKDYWFIKNPAYKR